MDPKIAAKVLPLGAKLGTAMKKSLGCAGFNLVQNNGEAAGQTVFHFHVHVIPRYEAVRDRWMGTGEKKIRRFLLRQQKRLKMHCNQRDF